MDGVIRAISPGLVLRSYLESFKTFSLDRLKKILRSHYRVKNTMELCQSLASISQSGKETPQAFLMRTLDLRQKILFASQEGEDSLKYDAVHTQSKRLYKSCSTPARNKQKKTINTAFASQHVPLKNRVIFDKCVCSSFISK